jgi:hypothetical protein
MPAAAEEIQSKQGVDKAPAAEPFHPNIMDVIPEEADDDMTAGPVRRQKLLHGALLPTPCRQLSGQIECGSSW